MATFNDLQPGYYYLIKEHENAAIELVFVSMETNKCLLIEYQDADQTMNWFKKTDAVHEVIERLSEEQAMVFESLFTDDEEQEDLEWGTDEDGDDWFSPDFEDDEDDEKRKAMNN